MEQVAPNKITVYFDMDNVLALFSTRENEEYQLSRMYDEGFYRNLPLVKNAYGVVGLLRAVGVNVKVVSGLINSPYVRQEKIDWCVSKLNMPLSDIYLCPMDDSKADLFDNLGPYDILVDDWFRYIDEWKEKGGTGLLFRRKEGEIENYQCVHSLIEVLEFVAPLIEFTDTNLYQEFWDGYLDLLNDSIRRDLFTVRIRQWVSKIWYLIKREI